VWISIGIIDCWIRYACKWKNRKSQAVIRAIEKFLDKENLSWGPREFYQQKKVACI
jgi:hypothetical protein